MSFFGPGSLLSGYEPTPPGGLDPQLYKALMSAFPGLQSLGQQGQQPSTLQSLGYQWPGTQFFQGQGTGSFQSLSPFEGAKGFGSESITGGLASGTLGKSQSQQAPSGSGLLSLPSLQLPQAVAFQQASFGGGGGGDVGMGAAGEGQGGGFGDVVGTALGGGQKLLDLFGGTSLGTQTQTPGYQAQRAGERTDYSSATGTPSGLPQSLQGLDLGVLNPTLVPQQSLPSGTQFSTDVSGFGVMQPTLQPQYSLPSDTTFSMPGQGETMMAPGGSAQQALGPQSQATPQGDVLGGGLSTLQGLLNLYQGSQTGDVGSLLGGAGGTLGGLGQMAPAQVQALEAALGLGQGTLGLVSSGLGGLAGGYGVYQGIQEGDPLQALMSAGSLYSGAVPLVNAAASQLGSQFALPTLTELAGQGVSAVSPALASALGLAAPTTAAAAGAMGGAAGALSGAGISGALGAELAAASTAAEALSAGGAAAAGTTGATGGLAGLSSTLGAVSGPALIAAMVLYMAMDAAQQSELQNMRGAGWWNNPIAGQLYSNASAGVGSTNKMLSEAGDLAGKDTWELGQMLSGGLDSLLPYYATAQGGRGAIKASDTITGRTFGQGERPTPAGFPSPAEYTANYQQAQQGIVDLVKELMGRGVTYEQLGQLPVSGDWAQQTLDAGGTPWEFLNALPAAQRSQLMQEGSALYGKFGGQVGPMASMTGVDYRTNAPQTPQEQAEALMALSLGSSMLAPSQDTNASGLYTNMYGGPLWAALARSGVSDPTLQGLMQQHFDPWVTARDPAFQQRWTGARYTPEDIANYEAQHGAGSAQAAGLTAGGLVGGPIASTAPAPAPDFWGPLGEQWAQQHDPATQALTQFQQQVQALQGQLPQLAQAAQVLPTGGLDTGALAALQPAMAGGGGGGMNTSGVDLMALLRQLGYVA